VLFIPDIHIEFGAAIDNSYPDLNREFSAAIDNSNPDILQSSVLQSMTVVQIPTEFRAAIRQQ
jgi:hypothetical protein